MCKKEILDRIEWILQYKDEGEHHLHLFQGDNKVQQNTYKRLVKKGVVHSFVGARKPNHCLYEVFLGEQCKIILSTISYTIPATELTRAELALIYKEMRKDCTHNGKQIYSLHG